MKFVDLINPTTGGRTSVPPKAVAGWEANGWQRLATLSDPPVPGDPEPEVVSLGDDPGEPVDIETWSTPHDI